MVRHLATSPRASALFSLRVARVVPVMLALLAGVVQQADAQNVAPVANADSYTVAQDSTLTVPAPGVLANDSDANGGTLTARRSTSPLVGTLTLNANGSFTFRPPAGYAGTVSFAYRAVDPLGARSPRADVTIAVRAAANQAPLITTAPVTTATVGAAYSYDVNATDPNGDVLTYALTQAPAGMAINSATGLIAWTPGAAQTGAQAVTVRVSDPGGLAAAQSFNLTVAAANANAPPVITTAPVTAATVGVAYSYDVNAGDPNGDVLSYALTQAPSGMSINAANGLIAWTPSAAQVGPQAVTVRVADPGGLAVAQAFTISVSGATVPSTTRVDVASPASYGAAAGSLAAITLNWYRVPMPANYLQFIHLVNVAGQVWSVDDHATASATWAAGPFSEVRTITVPTGLAAGSYDIRVGLSGGNPWMDQVLVMGAGVTDPSNDRRYKVGTLTVGSGTGNQAPQITSAAVTTAVVGTAYSYRVSASDPNGDALIYSLTQAPSGMSINATSGQIAWTPSSAQTGAQAITARVVDPGGLAATQAFSIAVNAAGNAAPQVTSTAVTTATVGTPYSYDVNATDPNGDVLTYSLTQAPAGMTINAGTGLISWTPGSAQTGNQTVNVRVADPGGLAATQAFTLSVGTAPPPPAGPMTMLCADGAGYQCSGETLLRTDNGIALTRSGVQAYGRSTSDMAANNPNVSNAVGLALTSGGLAELRVRKDSNAAPNSAAMLLGNLGIFWSGQQNRPQIIETFNPTAGRVLLNAAGALTPGTLPPSSDLSYYDHAYLGTAATRQNYASNRYFPRSTPPRCDPGGWCATLETAGPQFATGAWRSGTTDPDRVSAERFHEDGDIHAGNGLPDANGNPTWLPGGNGIGVPVPGSKGYRTLEHWSYRHGNLAGWFTQDTVNIYEWGGVNEHNKNRRGFVAYGETTDPALVPTSASASYVGVVRGTYSSNGAIEPAAFVGTVTVSVNFTSRSVSVTIQNTVRDDGSGASVPVTLSATSVLGAGGNANHLTGPASNASLSGGLGARLFGAVVAGGSGSGPAEMGGVFSLSNAGTGAVAVGGFIARKQ